MSVAGFVARTSSPPRRRRRLLPQPQQPRLRQLPRPLRHRPPGGRSQRAEGRRGSDRADRHHPEAAADPAVDRQEHEVRPGHRRSADHRDGGRRHPGRRSAGQGQDRLRRPGGREPVVPAVLRQGRARGDQGLPGDQLDAVRGHQGDHLPRQRQPRHRGGHPARADRPGDQGRRRPEHRRHRPQDRRPGQAHPGQQDRSGRAVRRDLHHHQHRLGRRVVRHPDLRAAAVGDPGHRRDRASARW